MVEDENWIVDNKHDEPHQYIADKTLRTLLNRFFYNNMRPVRQDRVTFFQTHDTNVEFR